LFRSSPRLSQVKIDEITSENTKAGVELSALMGENKDLAGQVQTLLKSRMSGSSSSSPAVIEEMQQNNQALVKEVNYLKATVDSMNDNNTTLELTGRLGEGGRGAKDGRSGWSEATTVYRLSLLKQRNFSYASPLYSIVQY